MKNLLFFLIIVFTFSCKNTPEKTEVVLKTPSLEESQSPDNQELAEIYRQDQADRQTENIDWSIVSENDRKREARIYELIEEGALKTSNDFHNAAMIFQHGGDSEAYGMAVKLMEKSVELDPNANKWLLAAATDRYLLSKGEPQIYGTQFSRKNEPGAKWERSEIDTTKITDEVRREYNVETLAEQAEKLRTMNLTSLSEVAAEGKSIDDIINMIKSEDLLDSKYNLTERGINSFGYSLMGEEKNEDALKIFKLNTELYPNAFNTHDSYGECLLKLGRKEEALKAYKKSVELNPENKFGIEAIKKITNGNS